MDDSAMREVADQAVLRGGRVAAARLGHPGYVKWKGHRDVMAEAALEVQDAIVAVLRNECPGDSILAEEGPDDEPLAVNAERLWIVDPICGSLNFVRGIPFFAVSVALRAAGRLRVGAVYDPVRDELFSARLGEPSTLNDGPIAVATVPLGPEFWQQAHVGTDLPHSGPRRAEALRTFNILAGQVLGQNIMGSPALGLCYVAAGRLHAYWTLDAKPWDIAAASLIVTGAGGLFTDAEGGSWLHSDGSYVAANPASHNWALQGIKWVRDQSRKQPTD